MDSSSWDIEFQLHIDIFQNNRFKIAFIHWKKTPHNEITSEQCERKEQRHIVCYAQDKYFPLTHVNKESDW